MNVTKSGRSATDPIQLGLALSAAVYHYEILKQTELACHIAKQVYQI
jgi:hypothetical protein